MNKSEPLKWGRARQRDLQRLRASGLSHAPNVEREEAIVDCGWGRLIFAQTFETPEALAQALRAERPDRRDIALYVKDPHVALSIAPQELFLDPSHTFRLDLSSYEPAERPCKPYFIRRMGTLSDAEAVNTIYASRGMVPVPPDFFWAQKDTRALTFLVAEDSETGEILGTAMGVDHRMAIGGDADGSSLWCLAVAPQSRHGGVGETLVRALAEHFKARGAGHMDLSVMHDNEQAIGLYERLGFERVQIFAIKRKNQINEKLYVGKEIDDGLNPYAKIIVNEARRRGIFVEVTDAEGGFFRLSYGGRCVSCRESLSEFTSAVAMSICDDKGVTRRVVEGAGVRTPQQIDAQEREGWPVFLKRHGSVVVKPTRGEQGRGVAVGLTTLEEIENAVQYASSVSDAVLLEECFEGEDLRLVVIDYKVVACAVRRPASVTGDGEATVAQLIEKQSQRRQAATGGESVIPVDAETRRCLARLGLSLDSVLEAGREIPVRRTANLHTGGTIHDVTEITHPALIQAAVKAARAIEIPVVGIDLMIKSPTLPDYVFIEANERPGLANHEPQPTAERFIDLLFPLSAPQAVRDERRRAAS